MRDLILLDFGASRTKAVRWRSATGDLIAQAECPSPMLMIGALGEVEVDPTAYVDIFFRLINQLGSDLAVSAIWFCCEMHGVVVIDSEGKPVTPYISWQDARGTDSSSERSILDILESEYGGTFTSRTGMRLRPGLPIVTLSSVLASKPALREQSLRIATLADWLLLAIGNPSPRAHPSLQAGLGLLDIFDGSTLIDCLARPTPKWRLFETLTDLTSPIGHYPVADRKIPIFGGIGDFPAAIHGMCNGSKEGIAINLGTGSQIAILANQFADSLFELRPGANGTRFTAVTHIPSGRALNVFAELIAEPVFSVRHRNRFWDMFNSLEPAEVLSSRINVNLAVFHAAQGFSSGGSISGILEETFTPRHLVASLARSWLQQYADILDRYDPDRRLQDIIIGGGMARRGKFVSAVLTSLSGRSCSYTTPLTGEETLDGLLRLAHPESS